MNITFVQSIVAAMAISWIGWPCAMDRTESILISGAVMTGIHPGGLATDSLVPNVRSMTEDPIGLWKGEIQFPGLRNEVMIRIWKADDESGFLGALTIPRTRTFGLALGQVTLDVTTGDVHFRIPVAGGRQLSAAGQLEGETVSGEIELPGSTTRGTFRLERVNDHEAAQATPRSFLWPDNDRPDWPTHHWTTSTPRSVSIEPEWLVQADQHINTHLEDIRAFLVVRHQRLVHEQYFHEWNQAGSVDLRSASKSVDSGIFGAALADGVVHDIDQSMRDVFPEYLDAAGDDSKLQITWRQLLDMTAGLRWVENGAVTAEWEQSPDMIQFTLQLPNDHLPGKVFNYNTALTHMLSVGLEKRLERPVREYAGDRLFEPMGIKVTEWWRDTQGHDFGGAGIHMTARDMARFGLLYLNRGRWEHRQLLPVEWITTSVEVQSAGDPMIGSYGYSWWLETVNGIPTFYAHGFGGQVIYVAPELDLVVVVASTTTNAANPALDVARTLVEKIAGTDSE